MGTRKPITIRPDRQGKLNEGLDEFCRRERARNPYRSPSREALARELILEGLARRKLIQPDSQ